MSTPTADRQLALLTPQQAAARLLEEALLAGYRSDGRDGLQTIKVGDRKMIRADHLDGFIRARLQGAI